MIIIDNISAEPKALSIIIPTYNSANVIQNCLESIDRQTFKNFEIIIFDAESRDHTIDIIRDNFSERSELCLISEKDNGVYDAMNKGIERARGEWIYFLGSDDCFIDDGILEKVMAIAECSSCNMLYGNVLIKGHSPWATENQVSNYEYSPEKIVKMNIRHQAIFYRKTIFADIGMYNTKYKVSSDYDMNLRCFAKTTTQYMDLIVCQFTCGGLSSRDRDKEFVKDFDRNIIHYFGFQLFRKNFRERRGYFRTMAREKLSRKNWQIGFVYLSLFLFHAMNNQVNKMIRSPK